MHILAVATPSAGDAIAEVVGSTDVGGVGLAAALLMAVYAVIRVAPQLLREWSLLRSRLSRDRIAEDNARTARDLAKIVNTMARQADRPVSVPEMTKLVETLLAGAGLTQPTMEAAGDDEPEPGPPEDEAPSTPKLRSVRNTRA
ncbi:hypothetical protein [Geodermatophilus nigrescens]|uniref:hypothetical protein n=1 Tax=Geodermatophilus nigrescens TaxID=1070870 RepID=UPI001114B449|nr:hypothetical protein [Geodermatophilus nigrescens]